jgi:glycosyltransferase involved in cell wall biosynthesis
MARASLYICNWSLNEPLCQSQTLAYLRALAADGYKSCLITFERKPYALSRGDAERARRRLATQGICWHPLEYHARSSSMAAAYDVVRGLLTAAFAIVRHGAQIVHARTSVPAGLGLLLARALRRPFLYDADSELSAEYADGGYWDRGGMRFRVLSRVEHLCRRHADAVVVLTDRMRAEFSARGVQAPMTVIPCCVDVDRFRFDDRHRTARRRELGADREKVLVYAGKIGPRYMVEEMMAFARTVAEVAGRIRVLVLTHEDANAFRAIATRSGLDGQLLTIRRVSYDEVPGWLLAADAGLALIRATDSERGSSPIKISEYLATGLPVVTTPAIGDLSAAIEERALGVVLPDTAESSRVAAARRLAALWREGDAVRIRCAAWARATIDVRNVAAARYARVYETLLASA